MTANSRCRAPLPLRRLPAGAVGLGLRPPHVEQLARDPAGVDFLELLLDNYIGTSDLGLQRLRALCGQVPLVGHCVGANLGGTAELDHGYLRRLAELADALDLLWCSDHICWSRTAGRAHHDLLPVPLHPDLVHWTAERAAIMQAVMGRPLALENLSAYVGFQSDVLSEAEFYWQVVQESGCYALLDVNNIVVTCHNSGTEPAEWLGRAHWDRVLQLHIAGHQVRPDGLRHDTHDRPPGVQALALRETVLALAPGLPTLLEWDDQIPPLAEALTELAYLRAQQANTAPPVGCSEGSASRPAPVYPEPRPAVPTTPVSSNTMPPPAWWQDMEEQLSVRWAKPLEVRAGQIQLPPKLPHDERCQAQMSALPPSAASTVPPPPQVVVADRLRLYHEQIWSRRLVAVQQTLAHLTEAVGPWAVNQLALYCLAEREWTDSDLSTIPAWVAENLLAAVRTGDLTRPELVPLTRPHAEEALRLDEALRRAHNTRWREPSGLVGNAVDAQLQAGSGLSLLQLRYDSYAEVAGKPPPSLAKPRQVVVYRARNRVVVTALHTLHARWLAKVIAYGRVVAVVEFAPPNIHDRVSPAILQEWLTQALELGWLYPLPPSENP